MVGLVGLMGLKAQVAAHWSTWAVSRGDADARGLAIVVTSLEASPPPSVASTTTAIEGLAPCPPSELKLLS